MRGRGGVAAALLLAVTAVSAPSVAQPAGGAPAPAEFDPDRMTELYNAGVAAADKSQWPKAYEAFLAAWNMRQHPQVAAHLGRVEFKLGKHRDAAEHLAIFLREATDIDAPARERAQQMLLEAKGKIGTLTISANRDEAALFVDGVQVGVSPLALELYVEPGERQVEARLPGGEIAKLTTEVAPGSVRPVELTFAKSVAGPAPPANVVVPVVPPPVEVGSGCRTAIAIGGIAGAVVAGGLGIGFAVASNAKAGDRDDLARPARCGASTSCAEYVSKYNVLEVERSHLSNGAIWSFVAAGGLGVGTLVYVLLTPAPRRGEAAVGGVSLSVGPGVIAVTRRW